MSYLFDSGAILGQHGGVNSVDVLDEVAHGVCVHGAERHGGRNLHTGGPGVSIRTLAWLLKCFFFPLAVSKRQTCTLLERHV